MIPRQMKQPQVQAPTFTEDVPGMQKILHDQSDVPGLTAAREPEIDL